MTTSNSGRAPTAQDRPLPPTPLSERSLAPDLARGMMLLLIALAHTPYFLYTAQTGAAGLHPLDGSVADKIAQAFTLIVVDARVHTMFGFLFAYGIGQMYARQTAKGTSPLQARRLLRRRHLWMIAFGAVHALLLWQGDIIGVYGLIGLIMVPLFFGRSDRTLKVWIGVLLALGALIALAGALAATGATGAGGASGAAAEMQRASIAEASYPASMAPRLSAWLVQLVSGVATLALPTAFLMGVLAARHRLLDEPGRHLVLLRRLALWGIAAGWAAGAVLALQHTTSAGFGSVSMLAGVSFFVGIFTGVGYAALFGLVAHWLSGRAAATAWPVRWLGALGRRSMSGYLAQSLVWGPVLAAWGLGLGASMSSWSASVLAVLTWALTVVGAAALERAGRRGPAEVLLRRLTYRSVRSPGA
ncbi:putative membrane protein YeiB [Nocardiopsis sp. Huas11]|uniref:DUF418 domain-containing protein n=1 Tax=Nocardiopsis sp. Huas11 TaxID=2183912 RepID=UPI000EB4E285|nr:DUF418 domain-containing protein [Nocardiopsis sp. Huas11]RKS08555.1 putative membrane protein YeiB [Nocardiopsis sp. Huas11]